MVSVKYRFDPHAKTRITAHFLKFTVVCNIAQSNHNHLVSWAIENTMRVLAQGFDPHAKTRITVLCLFCKFTVD